MVSCILQVFYGIKVNLILFLLLLILGNVLLFDFSGFLSILFTLNTICMIKIKQLPKNRCQNCLLLFFVDSICTNKHVGALVETHAMLQHLINRCDIVAVVIIINSK